MIRVTNLLATYRDPFDPTGVITKRCATKNGISPEEMQAKWKAKGDLTASRGSAIHRVVENFLLEQQGLPPKDIKDLLFFFNAEQVNHILEPLEEIFPQLTGKDLKTKVGWKKFLPEYELISDWFQVRGTADIIFKDNHTISIFDIKTYETFTLYDKYEQYFHAPIQHLQTSKYNTTAMQLSLYGLLAEEKFNLPIQLLSLLHYDYDLNLHIYTLPYMKHEATNLIADYASKTSR